MLISVIPGLCPHVFSNGWEGGGVIYYRQENSCVQICHVLLVGLSPTFPNIYEEAHWSLPANTIRCSPSQARDRRLAGEQHSSDTESFTWAAAICCLIIAQWLYTRTKHDALCCPLVAPAYHKPVTSYPVFLLITDSLLSFELFPVVFQELFSAYCSDHVPPVSSQTDLQGDVYFTCAQSFAKTGLIAGPQPGTFQTQFWYSSNIEQLITNTWLPRLVSSVPGTKVQGDTRSQEQRIREGWNTAVRVTALWI